MKLWHSRHRKRRKMPSTYGELQRLLPAAAIESVGVRQELVIYTGLCLDPMDPDMERLIPYHEDGPGAAYNALASAMESEEKLKGHWWYGAADGVSPYPWTPWP